MMSLKVDLIVTDMDGTAVKYNNKGNFSSSWDTVAEILSKKEQTEWFALAKKYYGTNKYIEWFESQIKLLSGKRLEDACAVLFPVPYSPGFKEFFSGLNGTKKAILSAGLDIVARQIANELSFHYWIAQRIGVKEGIFTGKGNAFPMSEKAKFLLELSQYFRTPMSRICYIGDTIHDAPCMNLAGFPVAINPAHGLEEYVIEQNIPVISDFRQLNDILDE